MVSSRDARTFTDSFMRGFSFVDDINARKRRERLLEEELADRRSQRDRQNRLVDEDRAIAATERQRIATDRQRRGEANALLADPNSDLSELQQYADIPEIAQFLRGERNDIQSREDLMLLLDPSNSGLTQRVAPQGGGAGLTQPTQQPIPGSLSEQVRAQPLPGDRFSNAAPRLTTLDLQRAADQDFRAASQASAQQQAREARTGDREISVASGPMGEDEFRPAPTQEEMERRNNRAGRKQLDQDWGLFLDVEDRQGDEFRNLPDATLTNQYFNDRNSLSPDVRTAVDARMVAPIRNVVREQREVLANPELGPQDQRAATLRLQRAQALGKEIGMKFRPLQTAGVDARGLPNNNANPQLTQNVLQGAAQQPGMPLPVSPRQSRADETMLNRGTTSGRISEKFAQAAFRQLKTGRLNWEQYESLMTTGRLPPGQSELKAVPLDQDLYRINPNGSVTLVRKGQRTLTAKEREALLKANSNRNLVDEAGEDYVVRLSKAYNTDDDDQLGQKLVDSFLLAIDQNEAGLSDLGRDMSNLNDVAWAWNRFIDIHNFEQQYNDEIFYNGRFMPDFRSDFGTISEAFLKPEIDAAARSGEIEEGFFGSNADVAPLPRVGNPALYEQVRQEEPSMRDASDEEIEAALQRAAGRR